MVHSSAQRPFTRITDLGEQVEYEVVIIVDSEEGLEPLQDDGQGVQQPVDPKKFIVTGGILCLADLIAACIPLLKCIPASLCLLLLLPHLSGL